MLISEKQICKAHYTLYDIFCCKCTELLSLSVCDTSDTLGNILKFLFVIKKHPVT